MRVRFLIPWRQYIPGQVFEDWPGGMAKELKQRGILEVLKDRADHQAEEQVVMKPPTGPTRQRRR